MIRVLRSTSLRLALGYAGLFIASSLLLVGLLWWRTAAYLDREIDAVILADTQAIADRFRDFGLQGAIATVSERAAASQDENAIYLLADPALAPVAGNLSAWPLQVGRAPGWHQADMVHKDQIRATRLLSVALPGGFHLLIGRDVQDRIAVRNLILNGLAWAAGAALVLAVLGGLLLRRALLRRVETINRTAAAIVHGDLARRLPVRGSPDEFDQLGQTINVMLEQIQHLIEGIRNVSNVLAHDLRTPIAELRTRLEELLQARPPPAATFETIEQVIADVDRVMAMFSALLRLAEIDSGVRRAGFRLIDPAEPVRAAAELYGPALEAKEIGFTSALPGGLPGGLVVHGDSVLLAQAVANLLDNAGKFTPRHGAVSLTLAADGDQLIAITVADNGPGIPEAERAQVTERFYRGDASRGTAGVGLGLSIVAAVARLHGGSLLLADNHPGLIASLILPAPPPKPGPRLTWPL
jgi:signal transduction histidine kinase